MSDYAPSPTPYAKRYSPSSIMRTRRFRVVNELIESIIRHKGSCRILDIGGTEQYWRLNSKFIEQRHGKITIVCVNLYEAPRSENSTFELAVGDATKSDTYKQNSYDLIHSNSVIEHVGGWANIRNMANCILGAAKPYYLQTPNYWFPIEPHFRQIGYQWLPEAVRARKVMKRKLGFRGPAKDWDAAMELVEGVKLLTAAQLRALFPEAELFRERIGPLTKSFMVVQR